MGMKPSGWNRREFLQAGAGMAAVAATGRASAGMLAERTVFAFAVSRGASAGGVIQSFCVGERGWQRTHEVAVEAVGYVCTHPMLPVVYACHDVAEWGYLPRGAVSAYGVDGKSGALTRKGTQPLSLGAQRPRFAMVASDGRSLVLLTRGGIYNVLPLTADGGLLPVSAIRKEYGRSDDGGSKAAAPRHVVEHPDGSLLAVDSGQETLSRLRVGADGVRLEHRVRVHAAAGARQVAISHCRRWAYVLHAEDASISVHRVTREGVLAAHQTVSGSAGDACMLLAPDGKAMVRADAHALRVLPIDAETGGLGDVVSAVAGRWTGLMWTPDGGEITGLDAAAGEVKVVAVHRRSGRLGQTRVVARVPGCAGFALGLV